MTDNLKGLLAKVWKDETIDLEPGRHYVDDMLLVQINGSVEKRDDEFIAPTVSIPLIPTLALFWEKCGVTVIMPSACSVRQSPKPCSKRSRKMITSKAESRTSKPPSRQSEPT